MEALGEPYPAHRGILEQFCRVADVEDKEARVTKLDRPKSNNNTGEEGQTGWIPMGV